VRARTHTKRYAAASPHLTIYILNIFLNSVTLTRNIELHEDDLNNDRNMLERFLSVLILTF
jgi:hypothetical protein